MCFDFGFGPFRWVCLSGDEEDLYKTDKIAAKVLKSSFKHLQVPSTFQLNDNLLLDRICKRESTIVGSKSRILYADAEGRIKIALAFNKAIKNGKIKGRNSIGRDHHDVSGTDSPYRENANIYDGSQFTADMAVHNFVGDAFRGLRGFLHNGGGVGWGETINGGFGNVY